VPAVGPGRLAADVAVVGSATAAIPLTLDAWLPADVTRPGVRAALLRMATVIFHPRPGEASVGRLRQFLRAPREGPFLPDGAEAGGMQGLIAPWARAITRRGGTLARRTWWAGAPGWRGCPWYGLPV
jgi:hypothetical protein